MTLELGLERINMTKHLWEEEFERQFKAIYNDYIEEGYDMIESKIRAMQDTKEVMQDQLDFVEELYDNTLNDLD
jgi:hypothetical protein|tara:strand:- start:392 stop:613 length:222 start_codon:yes stop_codon:yes gene_type:complete